MDDENEPKTDALSGTHAAEKSQKSALEAQFEALTGDQSGPQEDLFDIEEELGDFSIVESTRTRLASNKGAGRPKGSKNRANGEMRDALLKMGFNHPMLNLAMIANSKVSDLVSAMNISNSKAAELIVKANKELLPYFESKKPVELKVDNNKTVRHLMMIGEMNGGETLEGKAINVFAGDVTDVEENQ